MRNIYVRHEDANGKPLPDGEMEISKFGPKGFCIKMQVPVGNEYAWKFLQDIQQIMHYMSSGATVGDVDRGLKMLGEAEAYFTTWRQGDKLVPARKLAEAEAHVNKLLVQQAKGE